MNEQIQNHIDQYNDHIRSYFTQIREQIFQSTSHEIEEKLWAGLPSFYLGEKFIRIIPFKDHLNIEATAIITHKDDLKSYRLTPKGMLQIFLDETIPTDILQVVFSETLS